MYAEPLELLLAFHIYLNSILGGKLDQVWLEFEFLKLPNTGKIDNGHVDVPNLAIQRRL